MNNVATDCDYSQPFNFEGGQMHVKKILYPKWLTEMYRTKKEVQ